MSLIGKKTAAPAPTARRPAARAASPAPRGGGGIKFQYKARTAEEVRQHADRAIGGRDSYFDNQIPFFTPRVGENTVRILPPPPDAEWGHYGLPVVAHYDIGPDKSAFLCLEKMKGEACPLCDERAKATAAGNDDYAAALKPSHRVAVLVIDRAQEGKGPMLWNMSGGLDKDVTRLCIDGTSGEVLPVDDPNEGYDLTFTREGQGLTTKYKGLQFARKESPLSDDPDIAEQWLNFMVEKRIDERLSYHDADYLLKALEGTAPKEGGDEAPPAPTSRQRGKGNAPAATAPAPRKRVAAAQAPAKTAAKPAPEPAADTEAQPPSWEEIQELDEEGMVAVMEEFGIEPADSYDSIEQMQEWLAVQLGVLEEQEQEAPPPEPEPAAAPGGWRARLKKN